MLEEKGYKCSAYFYQIYTSKKKLTIIRKYKQLSFLFYC